MAAPNIEQALISFAKLIALLEGDSGALRWEWFAHPGDETLGSIHDRRPHLRDMLRALIDPNRLNTPDSTIDAIGYAWEPISITSGVGVGVAWNSTGNSLDLALAADAKFTEMVTLAVLAKLFHIKNGSLGGDFGNIKFGGTFPVPDFLKSGTLDGAITLTPAPLPPQIALGVTDKSTPARSRAVTVPTGPPNDVFAWDCARVAIFVIEAWIKQQAQNNGGQFFLRANEHLLPMFGAPVPPPQPIGVFPLFQPTGEDANFAPWMDSVLTLEGGAPGALTFLWHMRALVTGNESGDFIQGSLYFPLVPGPDLGNQPPSFNPVGSTPPDASTPGAWFVIKNPDGQPSVTRLLLELHANNTVWRAPLADANGGTLSRPNVTAQDWVPAAPPATIDLSGDLKLTIAPDGGGFAVTLVGENLPGPAPLAGQYTASVVVKQNEPVTFRMQLGGLPLVLPPTTSTKEPFGLVAQWLLKTAAAAPGNSFPAVTNALSELVKTAITGTPDAGALVLAIADVMAESQVAGNKATIAAGPLSVGLVAGNPPSIEGALTFEKIVLDQLKDVELRIGKLTAKTGFNLKTGALSSVSLGINDLRLVSPAGSGLIASILPDLTQLKGFDVKVAWAPSGIQVSGGAKIPIQQTLGPLNVSALLVRIDAPKELMVGVDLSLTLGPVLVSAYELGVIVPFSATAPTPFLHGLALSMDTELVRLAGLFGKVDEDYVGGLVVKVASLFELSAIGGYTQLPEGDTSLFMFASLVAPLGGTPYFFLTGIAGGFGYNRTLPPSGLLADHPFLRIMNGDLKISGDISTALVDLSYAFVARKGVHWMAAGIQFNSFGFINGKLVAAVSVGNVFSIQILGMASFGIAPIAYFELAFETSVDEEKFLLKAGLTPNSYIIHPDIFSLRGEFGLGVWHSGDHSGDFILSIGGYHPYFKVPEHYPTLERVGVKANVFGFVKLSVEVFFACTPQAIMAGAAISLSAEFGDIGAGLDVYIDVLITWDPFTLRARMGVVVWFQFMGRHEIGVDLEIWTPPFGGLAVIDLALVSFEVEFGDDRDALPPPSIAEFLEQQLSVPAIAAGEGARVAAFSTATQAGLFKVDLLEGRATKDESKKKSPEQEGLDTPIPVKPEFAFSVRSRLPLAASGVPHAAMSGEIDLPLCEKNDNQSKLTVSATKIGDENVEIEALDDWFPAAQFGDALEVTQADGARQNVNSLKSDEPTVPRREGAIYRYVAPLRPAELKDTPLNSKDTEPTDEKDLYPVPLAASGPMILRTTKSALTYAVLTSATAIKPRPKVENRRASATRALQARRVAPVRVVARSADFDRSQVVARLRGQTLATVPAGVATIAVPASPVRAAELYAVTLRLVGARTAAPVTRIVPTLRATRLTTKPQAFVMQPIAAPVTPVSRPVGVTAAAAAAAAALLAPSKGPITVNAGKAVHLEVSSGRVRRGSLTSTQGRQIVRAIPLGAFDHPLNDVYIGAGERASLPAGTRGVVLIGEGAAAPVSNGPSPVAQENIGIEHDTSLLAVGPRVFAGHGCVVQSMTSLRIAPDRLETVPGYQVLRGLSNARIHFPAAGATATLVITVAPVGPDAPPAMDEVRWAAIGATIANLQTVVSAGRTAFVMSLRTAGRWRLDVDLGRGWRLTAAVACTAPQAAIVDQLRSAQEWEFVDDRLEMQRLAATATIDVEMAS